MRWMAGSGTVVKYTGGYGESGRNRFGRRKREGGVDMVSQPARLGVKVHFA